MSARDQARALLNGRQVIFALVKTKTADPDLAGLRQFVAWAADQGATHIDIGTLPWRWSWFLPDNSDPYATWCNQSPGLFRLCPPPALAPWIPAEEVAELQRIMRERVELLREYGLKGVVNSIEPLWLPEGVYRAHPRWRGAQCELGRIARRPYFTPNLDEPEVIALYREAMQQFATLLPEIDQFTFMTNDSGGGIAWCPNLYPGMNGPPATRTRDPGQRIAGWLKALQEGAKAAGNAIRINLFSSGLPAELVGSTRVKLPPGLFLNWGNEHGEAWGGAGASLGADIWGASYPALGLGDVGGFLRGLQSV